MALLSFYSFWIYNKTFEFGFRMTSWIIKASVSVIHLNTLLLLLLLLLSSSHNRRATLQIPNYLQLTCSYLSIIYSNI
jgi:hypothetical protein